MGNDNKWRLAKDLDGGCRRLYHGTYCSSTYQSPQSRCCSVSI